MERLRDAFSELTSGPPRRRARIWEVIPSLLQEAEHLARERKQTPILQTASHLVIGEVCLEILDSGALTELVLGSSEGQTRLRAVRGSITALMIRCAAAPSTPDLLLRQLARSSGDDHDPFRHVRAWTETFVPGRETVPETDIGRGLASVFYHTGLLRRGPGGGGSQSDDRSSRSSGTVASAVPFNKTSARGHWRSFSASPKRVSGNASCCSWPNNFKELLSLPFWQRSTPPFHLPTVRKTVPSFALRGALDGFPRVDSRRMIRPPE